MWIVTNHRHVGMRRIPFVDQPFRIFVQSLFETEQTCSADALWLHFLVRHSASPKDVVLAEELLGHLRRMERLKPDGARSADEVQALAKGEAPLGFEAWAELSLGFLGAPLQEKLEALGARKLTREE